MPGTNAAVIALSVLLSLAPAALADGGKVGLTWIAGSTVKVEQMIGDCDYTAQAKTSACTPTTSRTVSASSPTSRRRPERPHHRRQRPLHHERRRLRAVHGRALHQGDGRQALDLVHGLDVESIHDRRDALRFHDRARR